MSDWIKNTISGIILMTVGGVGTAVVTKLTEVSANTDFRVNKEKVVEANQHFIIENRKNINAIKQVQEDVILIKSKQQAMNAKLDILINQLRQEKTNGNRTNTN